MSYSEQKLQIQSASKKLRKSQPQNPTISQIESQQQEYKKIISDYQTQLYKLSQENEKLLNISKELEGKIFQTSKLITEFKTDNSNILIDQEYYQTLVTQYSKALDEMNKTVSVIIQPERTTENNSNNYLLQNKTISTLLQGSKLNSELKTQIQQYADKSYTNQLQSQKLKEIANTLIQENLSIKQDLEKYEKQKVAPKICITCGEEYYPSQNNEKSCVYHPGRIKYFSCRQCGGDEYYTCCLMCSNCKKGCRTRKHMSDQ